MSDKLMLKCKDCGRVFYNDERKDLCFPCFNLKRYREAQRLPYVPANSLKRVSDSGVAESKPSNLIEAHTALKPSGFDDEAALLESCWNKVHEFKLKPSEESATSLTATLFISLSKTAHIKEMRR